MRVRRNRGYPALISPFTKYRLANPGGDHLEPCDTGSPAGHTIAASSCSTKGIPATGFVFGRGKIASQSLSDRTRVDLSVEGQVNWKTARSRGELRTVRELVSRSLDGFRPRVI